MPEMMNYFLCRYCKSNLDAYLDGQLSGRARRRIDRHIDTCPGCYQAYLARRDLRRELQQSFVLVGQNHQPDFARIWRAVQAEIPRRSIGRTQFRYGLVVLLMLLGLVLPFTLGNYELGRAVPSQPQPQTDEAVTEPPHRLEPDVTVTAVASNTMQLPPPTQPFPAPGD
jgi:anti-sigma factor RsiW